MLVKVSLNTLVRENPTQNQPGQFLAGQSPKKIMNRKGAKLAKEQRGEKMINREGEWSNTNIGFAIDWSIIYNILAFAFIASLRFNFLAKKCKRLPVILQKSESLAHPKS